MPSDHLVWSAFRALTFLPERTPSKSRRYAHALTPKRLIEDDQKVPKIECVKFTVNLTFQLKVTDSVAQK